MRRKTIILLLVAAILFPGFAGAASEKEKGLRGANNRKSYQSLYGSP